MGRSLEMFKKLKILTLLQLSDRVKIKKDLTIAKKIGQIGKTLLGMLVSFGIFSVLFYAVFGLIKFKASENLLTLVIFATQVLSIISCSRSAIFTPSCAERQEGCALRSAATSTANAFKSSFKSTTLSSLYMS